MKGLFLFILTLLPVVLTAHEGHGVVETGPAHYLLTPEHSILIVAVILGLILLVRRYYIRKV